MTRIPHRSPRSSSPPAPTADPAPTDRERDDARQALRRAAEAHRIDLPADSEDGLVAYLALLVRWRGARRITGPGEPEALAVEAIVDAVFINPLVPAAGTLLDVGSGAGLPGIPLALLASTRQVTLVESKPARVGLLRLATALLGLDRVTVASLRAEDLAKAIASGEERPGADAAIARAFLPPPEWLALAVRIVRPGGTVIVLATDRWAGPGPEWQVVERRAYRLRDRNPRVAWRLAKTVHP